MELKRYEPLHPAVVRMLEESEVKVAIGDSFITADSRDNNIYKILDITFEQPNNPKDENDGYFSVKYLQSENWDCTEWKERSSSFDYFVGYYTKTKIDDSKTIAEWLQEANDVIDGKVDIGSYDDANSDTLNSETAMISSNAKNQLMVLQQHLEEKKNKAEIVRAFVNFQIERKKAELKKITDKLYGTIQVFKKKIEKVMKVIVSIELYLGINEDIFQIQEGEKAPSDTPISLRQMILFMDEEIGHWKGGGLDYTNIEWFDKWLLEKHPTGVYNYENLLPEKKGILVFKPRRYNKDYGGGITDAILNANNKMTYFFIRNGESLYRLYSDNIHVCSRLFPKRDELNIMLKKLAGEYKDKDNKYWGHDDSEKHKERAEDDMYYYRKSAILVQGLIDRSEVFSPMDRHISLMNMSPDETAINFIYDDEATLPSGRLSFKDWQLSINGKLKHGSRVFVNGGYSKANHDDRIYNNTNFGLRCPLEGTYSIELYRVKEQRDYRESEWIKVRERLDAEGISYVIKEELKERYCHPIDINDWAKATKEQRYELGYRIEADFADHLTILYNPKDRVYGSWDEYKDEERKKRLRFRIKKTDTEILNYDQIDLDDIDFYLTSRTDRPNYLSMMPTLRLIKEQLLKEKESESHFIKFLKDRNVKLSDKIGEEALEQRIEECISWWKYKNMWKRSIDKDDTLALRMIEKRINSKNYK